MCFVSNETNMSNFQPLDFVNRDRDRDSQNQVVENVTTSTQQDTV